MHKPRHPLSPEEIKARIAAIGEQPLVPVSDEIVRAAHLALFEFCGKNNGERMFNRQRVMMYLFGTFWLNEIKPRLRSALVRWVQPSQINGVWKGNPALAEEVAAILEMGIPNENQANPVAAIYDDSVSMVEFAEMLGGTISGSTDVNSSLE